MVILEHGTWNRFCFDTHAYVKKLQDVGVAEAQAEVHAEALAGLVDERLVTRQYLDLRLKELEAKILESKLQTIQWVAGMLIGQALLIIGVLKFL